MGLLADRLDTLTIRCQSPDGLIVATARRNQLESCEFSEGAYERYESGNLEHQLERLATLLYVGYERGVSVARGECGLGPRRKDASQVDSEAERAYIERVYSITVAAAGPRDMVWFATTGMMEWECDISDDALRRLSESEFLSETMSAARAILVKSDHEVALLKDEYFDMRIPKLTAERKRRAADSQRNDYVT